MNKLFTLLLLTLIGFSACNKNTDKKDDDKQSVTDIPYVIMLSMDGFRWDYTDKTSTPNFDKIEQIGVKSRIQASFPTKTFPNHYSIATGLYPDHHGIVNNTFWDPQRGVLYKISDRSKVEDGYFYGGEPIWVTAEKQNVRSASYFWVGSEAEIDGYRPSIWKRYEHNFPFYQRADSVIAWLQLPKEKRPHLITWYVSQPDSYGHKYGPYSQEIRDTVSGLDKLLGYFMDKLASLDIAKNVNVIITSDHGMEAIVHERSISLSDYVKSSWVNGMNGGNPTYNIWVKDGFKDSVRLALNNIPHLHLYDKNNVPARLHYMTNERCGDFVATADSSWALFSGNIPNFTVGGTHGYDNNITSMDATFYAYGPAFKVNYRQEKFRNIDIYELICTILKLEPGTNDGDLEKVKSMLK
ncbi:MAG: alkaline phosphatase family protein [Bacteroidetes bacterium]|nr:MAG: alkaline phosphatase family protein [Bacteroidota bacterium]